MRAHRKLEESGEARNENDTRHDEMGHPGIHTRHDHVPGRMREEGRSAAAPAATRANRSHSLFVGEPEYYRQGPIDVPDLADHERNRRQHRRNWRGGNERLALGYAQ